MINDYRARTRSSAKSQESLHETTVTAILAACLHINVNHGRANQLNRKNLAPKKLRDNTRRENNYRA
jgi:hypothetical protein